MAQLFQPTNITPDTRGSFGNGVVLVDPEITDFQDTCTVSWQVNGTAPMTAFQIDFTDVNGNALYSTGRLTDGCPFYGTDQNGNPVLFSYTIVQDDYSTSFLRRASEGLFRITQYWDLYPGGSVTQQSPSYYIVRNILTGMITSDSGTPITGRVASFTGDFNGIAADEDGLMWIRWVLTRQDTGEVIKDTGRIYGNAEPVFSYDGFLPGNYTLELSGETSVGVLSEPIKENIQVSYTMETTSINPTASRDCNGESAVSVRWPRFQNIPLTSSTGDVTDDGTKINLPTDEESLEWHTVNNAPMNFSAPWSAIWSGRITDESGKIFSIQTSNARYDSYVGDSGGRRAVYVIIVPNNGAPSMVVYQIAWEAGDFMCIITPDAVYWKCMTATGGPLYPLETLFPSRNLYPGYRGDLVAYYAKRDIPDSITQGNITSTSLYGPSSVYYFKIIDYGMTEDEAYRYLFGSPSGLYGVDTYFYLGPKGSEQDYNAGNWFEYLRNGTTIQIYRQTADSQFLEYAGETSVGKINRILDYAARSQQGPYRYYLYIMSAEKYINIPFISNQTDPCFWDWSVLACTENADKSYTVLASYNFGNNLQSGGISNNNQPGVFKNFTPYPTVMIAPQNYQSGTLQSLIGYIKNGEYSDTIDLRDAIFNLSTTTNTLFLKNRKGDLLQIRPGGEIRMETSDNTREQAQTVGFPWIEVGDASDFAIFNTGGAT